MNNSLKIGIVSGLIAGIVLVIVGIITAKLFFNIGYPYFYLEPFSIPIGKIVTVEIILGLIWGIIFGIIYSRFHNLLPGKSFVKGFYYGLILWVVLNIRPAILLMMYYGWGTHIISWIFMIALIIYGLILGIIYDMLRGRNKIKKEIKLVEHDFKKGIQPGAIAGIVYGIIIFAILTLLAYARFWGQIPGTTEPSYSIDIGFMMSQLGTHILFNLIFGAFFGYLYAIFYDGIPNRGIIKGLYFGLMLYLIANFRIGIYCIAYGLIVAGQNWAVTGFFAFVAYGIVLGSLYKR